MCVLYNGSVVEADVPPVGDVKRLLPTIMRALDVYPAGGLKNVGFRHVIFCVGLAENGEPLAGLAATYSGTIFLDARGCQVSPMHKVHHELFHLLVAKAGPDSQAWEALESGGLSVPRRFAGDIYVGPAATGIRELLCRQFARGGRGGDVFTHDEFSWTHERSRVGRPDRSLQSPGHSRRLADLTRGLTMRSGTERSSSRQAILICRPPRTTAMRISPGH